MRYINSRFTYLLTYLYWVSQCADLVVSELLCRGCACIVNIWNSLPNSIVDACTVNPYKARLDKFWQHQLVKFDFTADLTGTGNQSEEVIKRYCLYMIVYNNDAKLEVSDTCVRNSLLS